MFFVSVLNYMKIFSTLDLKTLVLISYTWRSYHSHHKEQSGKLKQLVEGKRQRKVMEAGEESEVWLLGQCLEIATILASCDAG